MKRYKKANEGIHAPEEVRRKAVRPSGRRSYTKWAGAVAAVLAVAIIGGAALWPRQGGPGALSNDDPGVPAPFSGNDPVEPRTIPGDEANHGGGTHQAHALSLAANPENPGRARAELSGGQRDFLSVSSAEFLSGTAGENRVYSPVNVYMALAILAETAGGDSRQQILELLGADSAEALREDANALWLACYREGEYGATVLANSLWLRDGTDYHQGPLDILARDYYASSFSGKMGSEEYDQALRDWLNEQTHGLLEEQAADLALDPDTVIALASTLYFKAPWAREFWEENTRRDVFHTAAGDVETDFMHQYMTDTYYWGEHFSAAALWFADGGSMWLILPDEGHTVDELVESGEAMDFLLADKRGSYNEETDEFEGGWPGQKWMEINLAMPRFDVSSDLDLLGGLAALGVTDALDPGRADFSPLTDRDIYVSKAQHAARVTVDEKGCEAAAYTVIANPEGAPPPGEEIDFVLDRPFLFAVTNYSDMPLFVGIVNQPNG